MNFIDYIILALLIWGFIIGFRKGLIGILCNLAGAIIGALLALKYMQTVGAYLHTELSMNEKFGDFLGFVAIFALIYIGFFILGKSLSKAVSLVMLGFVNRLAGGILGMIKYLIFMSVMLSLSSHFNIKIVNEELRNSSTVLSSVQSLSDFLSPEIEKIKKPLAL